MKIARTPRILSAVAALVLTFATSYLAAAYAYPVTPVTLLASAAR